MSFLKRLLGKREKEFNEGTVVFIGLGGAGKTTILNRLIHGEFTSPGRTMGLNVDEFTYRKVRFRTFDLGGQETFHTLWSSYVQHASAVVYVVDASNPLLFPESYNALKTSLLTIPSKAILMILANKSDLDAARTLDEILKVFDLFFLQNDANLKAINIFLISAKTGDSFNESFDWLVSSMTGQHLPTAKINIHHVWIYEKVTGLPLANARIGSSEDQPELVTPLLSAIDSFASELDSGVSGISNVVLETHEEGKANYRLVKVVGENLVCILAVNEFDSVKKTSEIGNEVISWLKPRIVRLGKAGTHLYEEIPEEDFTEFIRSSYAEHLS
ncbi:MAG: ADP-ribosylation factor family protein [Candidatus Hodarchaeales archaeon]|jgi:small GTP-binding protein